MSTNEAAVLSSEYSSECATYNFTMYAPEQTPLEPETVEKLQVAVTLPKSMSDEEIVELRKTSLGRDRIIRRYTNLVRSLARNYFAPGMTVEDVAQEGFYGLAKAIDDYKPGANVSFTAFAVQCVKRQLITAIKTAKRQKHIPLNQSASFDAPLKDAKHNLPTETAAYEVTGDPYATDPAEQVVYADEYRALSRRLTNVLSALEYEVLALWLEDASYKEIATDLDVSLKTVDNTLQRVRRKVYQVLKG